MLRKKKIPHYHTYPNCPKQNSIVERSIQTDVYEFYRQGNLVSGVKKQNEKLSRWNEIYNDVRPHQSLDYRRLMSIIKNGNKTTLFHGLLGWRYYLLSRLVWELSVVPCVGQGQHTYCI